MPSKLTPPYYVAANFIGGIAVSFVYLQFAKTLSRGASTALLAAELVWLVTRIYGGGHVVMGQMPLRIFATMSAGLALGYALGAQAFRALVGH